MAKRDVVKVEMDPMFAQVMVTMLASAIETLRRMNMDAPLSVEESQRIEGLVVLKDTIRGAVIKFARGH